MNTILKLGPNSVVSQPGDPLVSPDGTVSVNANNDGTASITRPVSGGGTETRGLAIAPPYDAQIEYLESTGTQYIDTGIVPYPVDTEIEVSVSNLSGSSNNLFYSTASFAVGLADENSGYPSADIMASKSYCHFRFGESSDTSLKVALNGTTGRHIFRLNGSKKEAYVDAVKNDLTSTKTIASWSTNSYTAYIFATRSTKNGSATNISKSGVRLHECRIYQSGAIVRDFIPVRVGSGANAVGYLYDRVSGNLFGNAGTGNFTLGADVPPGLARVATTGAASDLSDWPSLSTITSVSFTNSTSYALSSATFRFNPLARVVMFTGGVTTSIDRAAASGTSLGTFTLPISPPSDCSCAALSRNAFMVLRTTGELTMIPAWKITANTTVHFCFFYIY